MTTGPAADTADFISGVERKALADEPLTWDEAARLARLDTAHIYDLIAAANRIRRRHKGDEVSLCAIINAKSGRCPEDCAFCSQSVRAKSGAPVFDLLPPGKIVDGAREALAAGARKFGIVTSGYGYSASGGGPEIDSITKALDGMRRGVPIHRCASLGIIDHETAERLRNAGLQEYHHNLETARSFFPQVCSTHDYEEDVATIRAVKAAGLRACCGGVFGMGESPEQRVELAFTLRDLDVDSIPLNFLTPIKGTRLEDTEPLPPLEILKIIAMYRMILPTKDIKVAGGREKNLRDLQCLIFAAGANSTMVGDYLTTQGRSAGDDLRMIADLGLSVREE
ncbi:MAG: biotin synthase BioB [Candidatus Nitrospinota bacterium M3_3B_026]